MKYIKNNNNLGRRYGLKSEKQRYVILWPLNINFITTFNVYRKIKFLYEIKMGARLMQDLENEFLTHLLNN